VARRALSPVPLRFVLVTAEALLHRGQTRAESFHDARVARHALTLNPFQRQVSIVVEGDRAVGMLGGRGKQRS
jgi:hypothetical protein